MSAMWDALLSVAVSRVDARREFWIKKARENLDVHPDKAMLRAEECAAIASMLATLKETYTAPDEPTLTSERRARLR